MIKTKFNWISSQRPGLKASAKYLQVVLGSMQLIIGVRVYRDLDSSGRPYDIPLPILAVKILTQKRDYFIYITRVAV